MSRSILQSRWLLVAVAVMGVALGVQAALRLDYLVGPAAAPDFMTDD